MPDVRDIPEDSEDAASTAGDDHNVELLLAGFRACAKEAIRFLLEEEGLAPDHELPVGLQEHLDRQQSHLAGMLQNDSGLGTSSAEDSFFFTSADDGSFSLSEVDDVDSNSQEARNVVDTCPSNASTDSVSPNDSDRHAHELPVTSSSSQ